MEGLLLPLSPRIPAPRSSLTMIPGDLGIAPKGALFASAKKTALKFARRLPTPDY
jgi:hypothetical protein